MDETRFQQSFSNSTVGVVVQSSLDEFSEIKNVCVFGFLKMWKVNFLKLFVLCLIVLLFCRIDMSTPVTNVNIFLLSLLNYFLFLALFVPA